MMDSISETAVRQSLTNNKGGNAMDDIEIIIDHSSGDMFIRCDECLKLHNELDLNNVLICKSCEGKND